MTTATAQAERNIAFTNIFTLDTPSNQPQGLFGDSPILMALPPVIILPVSYLVFWERIGWQAILETILAIAGVGILFLV